MAFDLSIVIDEDVINEIPNYSENKFVLFLLYWLQENNTKAVIIKSGWRNFNDTWETNLPEGVFSAIKRKNVNYLRSKREMSQDIELLLKALVYNLTIIGRFI